VSERETVVIAMSGGVDSSVAAGLLVEQGHDVVGMTMRVYQGAEVARSKSCCSLEDVDDARQVAETLGIPYYALDMKDAFQEHVIDDFVDEYLAGRTPNPCLRCNADMKFGSLLERAREIGADAVATGHYVRRTYDEASGRWELRAGRDPAKDQSYALYVLTQDQLARARFPLGEMTKAETREQAARLGLPVDAKPDSQDICFVPDGDYRGFVARQAGERVRPGRFVSVEGEDMGPHGGVVNFTVGQRRGLGLEGDEHPRYVVELRADTAEVVVGRKHQAARERFEVGPVNWVSIAAPAEPLECQVKVRHRSPPTPAVVSARSDGTAEVELASGDLGISPGQAAVFYDGDRVLGGGTIERVAPVEV
jgi:tRNA-specific 2-thiouridylase